MEWLWARYGRNCIPPPERCITCGGTGTFKWYVRSTTEVAEYKCNCEEQHRLATHLLLAGIGFRYQKLGWHDLVVDIPPAINTYLADAKLIVPTGQGLMLYGPPGTGKSLLVTLLLKGLIAQGHQGFFTTYADILTDLTLNKFDEERHERFEQRVKLVGVLVIDDIGQEQKRRALTKVPVLKEGGDVARDKHGYAIYESDTVDLTTAEAEEAVQRVLRARVGNQLPTFITTNLDIDDFKIKYGKNVASLLDEQVLTVKLGGEDWRKRSGARSIDEARSGLKRPIVL